MPGIERNTSATKYEAKKLIKYEAILSNLNA